MSNSPFLRRIKTQTHGTRSEKRVAKKLGARTTMASGALGQKGDADLNLSTFSVKIESKATKNNSLGLEYDWLLKITGEALGVGAMPMLTVSFTNEVGQPRRNGDWALMPLALAQELLEVRDEISKKGY